MKHRKLLAGALAFGCAVPLTALAADHLDSPSALADPTADITDLYAWPGGDGRIRLVLNVSPLASETSQFSTTTQYVLHTASHPMFGVAGEERTIACQAYSPSGPATGMECWVQSADGTVLDYVGGDASDSAGITSESGALRLFAGLRDDPFFFNLAGFNDVRATVRAAAPAITFDPAGCPMLDAATSAVLVSKLRTDPTSTPPGGAAQDFFAGTNVLAIVLDVDADLLTPGGDIVSVWASTHGAP